MILSALILVVNMAAPVANPLWLPETPNACEHCAEWNAPHAPVHVFGNTWWVGVQGLSVVAIDTGDGIILLDGALPQSVPLVKANLGAAGLDVSKVKFIGISHAHFDHVGGVAALQQATGATVLASASASAVLRSGCPGADDPQVNFGCENNGLPRVKGRIREVRDRDVIKLGNVVLTAHFTPGHTPGGMTWTWKSCEGSRCLDIIYADSLTPVSADGFRFKPIAGTFEASIAKVAALPCDVLLSAHPDASDTIERLSTPADGGEGEPPRGVECPEYAARAKRKLDARLKAEATQKTP